MRMRNMEGMSWLINSCIFLSYSLKRIFCADLDSSNRFDCCGMYVLGRKLRLDSDRIM